MFIFISHNERKYCRVIFYHHFKIITYCRLAHSVLIAIKPQFLFNHLRVARDHINFGGGNELSIAMQTTKWT